MGCFPSWEWGGFQALPRNPIGAEPRAGSPLSVSFSPRNKRGEEQPRDPGGELEGRESQPQPQPQPGESPRRCLWGRRSSPAWSLGWSEDSFKNTQDPSQNVTGSLQGCPRSLPKVPQDPSKDVQDPSQNVSGSHQKCLRILTWDGHRIHPKSVTRSLKKCHKIPPKMPQDLSQKCLRIPPRVPTGRWDQGAAPGNWSRAETDGTGLLGPGKSPRLILHFQRAQLG